MIPNCIIYGVNRSDSIYFYNMMTQVLGNCVNKVYIQKSNRKYDVLIVFKNVDYLTPKQQRFIDSIDRNNPVKIEYHNQTYYLYMD